MTRNTISNITFTNINENFPVAGQDNDTQVFRDNFDSIKTALSVAKTEISDLLGNAATKDEENDFNGNTITNAKFINNVDTILAAGPQPNITAEIDFLNGNYQIFTITQPNFTFELSNFPKDGNSIGKVTIELYSDSNEPLDPKKISFSLSSTGATSKKKNGFPSLTTPGSHEVEVSSTTNPVIIEIWRHTESTFFMKYVGTFS